jgi:hypothetical protein
MGFVVKAVGQTGTVCWLSEADATGFRSLAPRSMAGVFNTVQDAQTAIVKLPRAFRDAGLVFYEAGQAVGALSDASRCIGPFGSDFLCSRPNICAGRIYCAKPAERADRRGPWDSL